ncbi:AAA family ATPase [Mitsuaria sp. GD03876]|uniref:AAA family ATPase n=1 Tax=Mitsuaria sp. GD03876 TaxID=2975399 RepID=UPI002446E1D8|nr:AAA family ATPase [Mitsuaria sp. GD03876]MDH0865874.1 AAA family ATPase [Mitsuaria sp. GD03876]
MYIERIELKNYRGHEHLEVRFARGLSVVAGVNGAGKTSLLHALFEALTQAVPALPNIFFSGPFSEPGFAWVKVVAPDGRVRFEEQYPVEIDVVGEVYGSRMNWKVQRTLGHIQLGGSSPNVALQMRALSGTQGTEAQQIQALPVVAFYRASRAWHVRDTDALSAAVERNSRGHGYESWATAGQDAESLQRWVVAKSLERLQVASESGRVFSKIDNDELGQITRALRSALESFEFIRYDFQSKKILVDWHDGDGARRDPVAFEHLSAGQRAVICLIADIARRMCLLNPHLGDEVISSTEGIVLIDELDMHLHPEWQRALTRGLTKAFPKVQFIVASHSPQVIGELPHDHVILLTPEGPVNPPGSFGMTSNQVLQELMSAEVRATPIKERLDEIDEALTRNQLDVAEQKIDELAKDAPEVRELIGKEALLQRKRTLGR